MTTYKFPTLVSIPARNWSTLYNVIKCVAIQKKTCWKSLFNLDAKAEIYSPGLVATKASAWACVLMLVYTYSDRRANDVKQVCVEWTWLAAESEFYWLANLSVADIRGLSRQHNWSHAPKTSFTLPVIFLMNSRACYGTEILLSSTYWCWWDILTESRLGNRSVGVQLIQTHLSFKNTFDWLAICVAGNEWKIG